MTAPLCNRCRHAIDDGQHTKVDPSGTDAYWTCARQNAVGSPHHRVTTPGADAYPPRCNHAVAGTARGCTLAWDHDADITHALNHAGSPC